ncbi:ATP-dependent nuclease [Oleiharenicola lentus]|uniref:ATP-dependent nuclease n=1 Tax=Oleiharenicola lentus TaxID=2508720 RepID=UPI003F6730A7
MLLRRVKLQNFGAFHGTFDFELESDVTILTGANDAGKSSLLRGIELAASDKPMQDSWGNHERNASSAIPAQSDPSIMSEAHFLIHEGSDLQGSQNVGIESDDFIIFRRTLSRENARNDSETHLKKYPPGHSFNAKLPAVVVPSAGEKFLVNDSIDLSKPSPADSNLLALAFDGKFNARHAAGATPLAWRRQVANASDLLNEKLGRLLPKQGGLKFDLAHDLGGSRDKLGVTLRDQHDGVTPFGDRGTGVRRIISLLAELLTLHKGAHHKIILIDEPENSLHADAQHLMREFLFSLTADKRTQVVYATHSPSMINPLRGQQLRLLRRERVDGVVTTVQVKRADEENFLQLRTSLGLAASDSLLYAPVTVICEGSTEVGNFPRFFEKLIRFDALGGKDVRKLLGLCTFLDGNGDSVDYFARLAANQGARPILFLDGDKRPPGKQPLDREGVPTIYLPKGKELEDLVPPSRYLRALSDLTGVQFEGDPVATFQAWVSGAPNRETPAFSKKVEMWFRSHYPNRYPQKKALMKRALEMCEEGEIEPTPFRQLLERIEEQLAGTSFS